jgi:hypothetical protein
VSHPQFKLRWLETDVARLHGKSLLLDAILSVQAQASTSDSQATSSEAINNSDNDNFFCFYDTSVKNNDDTTELDMYL